MTEVQDTMQGDDLEVEELRRQMRQSMRFAWMDPRTLTPNARNWKKHPTAQREAYGRFQQEVGWVGALLYNETTGRLLDGHMRQEDALERNLEEVPVLVISADERTERRILALLDKIGSLFREDEKAIADLLQAAELNESEYMQLLQMGAEDEEGKEAKAKGEKVLELPAGGLGLVLGEAYNYVVLLFRTEVDWTAALDHFGIERVMCPFVKDVGVGRVIDGGDYLYRIRRETHGLDVPEDRREIDALLAEAENHGQE